MKIIFIGSGNLATQLSMALQRGGQEIIQVYSRTRNNAECLARKLNCKATDNIDEVVTDGDIYIFSVKDDALTELIGKLSSRIHDSGSKSLFLHTAGSVDISIFEGRAECYGVFYPMQTFSKDREVNFREIPVFIEGNDAEATERIECLAKCVSDSVVACDSEKRKYLHLGAVFACNMTNHCYRLCEQILQERNLDFNLFLPLINETARKVGDMSPREAQTGPMVRYDKSVMEKQLSLITNPLAKEIYSLMAESIHKDQKVK